MVVAGVDVLLRRAIRSSAISSRFCWASTDVASAATQYNRRTSAGTSSTPIRTSRRRWRNSIREQAKQRGLAELFEEVLVPTEKVVEVRRGRKVDAERKFFPGYVLVKMELDRRGLSPDQEHAEGDGLPRRRQQADADLGGRGRAHPAPGAGGRRTAEAVGVVRDRRAGAGGGRPVRLVQRHGGGGRRGALARSRSRCRSSAAPRRSNWNSARSRRSRRVNSPELVSGDVDQIGTCGRVSGMPAQARSCTRGAREAVGR